MARPLARFVKEIGRVGGGLRRRRGKKRKRRW